MRKNTWTLAVAGALALALVLYTICFTVRAGRAGAVFTLGAITDVKERPGLYAKWPWPFQSVEETDVRVRLIEVVGKEVQTKDQFSILLTISAGWRVRKERVREFLETFANEEEAASALDSEIADARQKLLQKQRLGDLISIDPEQSERYAAFEREMLQTVQGKLDAGGYGMAISFLKVRKIAFAKQTTEKVFLRMISERKRRSEAMVEKGRNEAMQIKDNAERDKKKLLAEAQGDALRIRGEGDAAAAEHYRIFMENPELHNFLRRLDALKAILTKKSTVVLPAKDPLDDILIEEPPLEK